MHFGFGGIWVDTQIYKKNLYSPRYNRGGVMESEHPDIFNEKGNKLDWFFVRDACSSHSPYLMNSDYMFFDRYNWGLKKHLYSHKSIFQTMGNPEEKYAFLSESKAIVPDDYLKVKKSGISKDFKYLFTYDDDLLNSIENAKFAPFCARIWYKKMDANTYMNKEKNISICSSDKELCRLHSVRKSIARTCKRDSLADVYGTIDGGDYVECESYLEKYRFSIVVENDISDYFFTEKITNCFASQTIPIYIGARKISDFFNPDGIIYVDCDAMDELKNILKSCTQEEYADRLPYVLENYKRVQQYISPWDSVYIKYIKK